MANDKNKVQGDQPEERLKALDAALKKIEKKFGKGSIMKMGGKVDTKISTISSGSIAIDAGLGVGGYPRGRIIEIYGPESSGKTTVALHAGRSGGICRAPDPERVRRRGIFWENP